MPSPTSAHVLRGAMGVREYCGYNLHMNVATSETSVGVRELRDALSRHLAGVREGRSVIVTDHGRPIARIVPYEAASPLERMIAEGVARPPLRPRAALPDPIRAAGTVSDLIAEQRR